MARSKVTNVITKTGDFILRWIVAILGFILLITAFMHGLSVGTPQYPYSPLIYIEIALTFVLIFLIPAYVISGLVSAVKKNWTGLRVVLVNLSFGLICVYGALVADAPTLISMT